MRIITTTERRPYRIAVYSSAPKSGKTRLVTSLPWDRWGDKGIYVAADTDSESLASVQLSDRHHLQVVKPSPPLGEKYDPLAESVAIAQHDWQKEGFGVLIWDTLTATAEDLLRTYAKLAKFANNPIKYNPGTPSEVAIPNEGDYGAAQGSVSHILNFLFNQPIHLIVVFQAVWSEPKTGEVGMQGGPATVGKAQMREVAGKFSSVIHIEASRKRVGTGPLVEQYTAFNSPHSIWLAGTRVPGTSIPDVVLDNPDPRKFWDIWEQAQGIKLGETHDD